MDRWPGTTRRSKCGAPTSMVFVREPYNIESIVTSALGCTCGIS
ncbi:MAG: hypothetical protein ACREOK_01085 [Gemmatimonadaceae bacterium]